MAACSPTQHPRGPLEHTEAIGLLSPGGSKPRRRCCPPPTEPDAAAQAPAFRPFPALVLKA